jgi:hypothetical protein
METVRIEGKGTGHNLDTALRQACACANQKIGEAKRERDGAPLPRQKEYLVMIQFNLEFPGNPGSHQTILPQIEYRGPRLKKGP